MKPGYLAFVSLALMLLIGWPSMGGAKTLRYASQFDPGTMDPHAADVTYSYRS